MSEDAASYFPRRGGEDADLDDFMRRAERGYQYDPVFHARAELAAQGALTVLDVGLSMENQAIARHAASLALVLADIEPHDGVFGRERQSVEQPPVDPEVSR